jgi:hypothetical protein
MKEHLAEVTLGRDLGLRAQGSGLRAQGSEDEDEDEEEEGSNSEWGSADGDGESTPNVKWGKVAGNLGARRLLGARGSMYKPPW